jgi:hypothetical protein
MLALVNTPNGKTPVELREVPEPQPATANLNLSAAALKNWNDIAFLVATQTGNGWKDGCANAACAMPMWSLQAIHQ